MKKKRNGVHKKKLIDEPWESYLKTAIEEHILSENVHSAGH